MPRRAEGPGGTSPRLKVRNVKIDVLKHKVPPSFFLLLCMSSRSRKKKIAPGTSRRFSDLINSSVLGCPCPFIIASLECLVDGRKLHCI